MNLNEYLKSLHIDDIEDDSEWMEKETEAILGYCREHTFNLSDEDMKYLASRIDIGYYYDWRQVYDDGLSDDEPWYTERWFDQDLINAMRSEAVPVTKKNLDKFRRYCRRIFDDKSERNEMLAQAAWECFDL